MLSVMNRYYEMNWNVEGDCMTNKKTPERFCIRFNLSNPEHLEVVNILSNKGRNAASYIADAILCYEKSTLDDTRPIPSDASLISSPQR